MNTVLVRTSLAIAAAAIASAQGADDCSNAQVIAGLGPHAFDNTTATKDGPNDCDGQPARKDVWFRWNAPQSGGYVIDTCGTSAVATRIMAYDFQPCPVTGAPIGCSAVGCTGIGSRFSFPTIAGRDYLIRVGSKSFNQAGPGTFILTYDNCWNLSDDAFEENDTCETAVPMDNGNFPGLFVNKVDKDFYELDVDDGGQLVVDIWFTHGTGDIDAFLFDACGSGPLVVAGSASDNEHIVWDNTTGACARVVLEVQHWVPDTQSECQTYDMDIAGAAQHGSCSGSGNIGTNYCGPANPNSSGMSAIIGAVGSVNVADNDVRLDASQMALNQFGMFVNSMSTGSVMPPGSQGNLCLSGGIGRHNSDIMNSGATGAFSLQLDLNNVPTPLGPVAIQPGETWYWQTWFRDNNPTSTSNFTDGIGISFL